VIKLAIEIGTNKAAGKLGVAMSTLSAGEVTKRNTWKRHW